MIMHVHLNTETAVLEKRMRRTLSDSPNDSACNIYFGVILVLPLCF